MSTYGTVIAQEQNDDDFVDALTEGVVKFLEPFEIIVDEAIRSANDVNPGTKLALKFVTTSASPAAEFYLQFEKDTNSQNGESNVKAIITNGTETLLEYAYVNSMAQATGVLSAFLAARVARDLHSFRGAYIIGYMGGTVAASNYYDQNLEADIKGEHKALYDFAIDMFHDEQGNTATEELEAIILRDETSNIETKITRDGNNAKLEIFSPDINLPNGEQTIKQLVEGLMAVQFEGQPTTLELTATTTISVKEYENSSTPAREFPLITLFDRYPLSNLAQKLGFVDVEAFKEANPIGSALYQTEPEFGEVLVYRPGDTVTLPDGTQMDVGELLLRVQFGILGAAQSYDTYTLTVDPSLAEQQLRVNDADGNGMIILETGEDSIVMLDSNRSTRITQSINDGRYFIVAPHRRVFYVEQETENPNNLVFRNHDYPDRSIIIENYFEGTFGITGIPFQQDQIGNISTVPYIRRDLLLEYDDGEITIDANIEYGYLYLSVPYNICGELEWNGTEGSIEIPGMHDYFPVLLVTATKLGNDLRLEFQQMGDGVDYDPDIQTKITIQNFHEGDFGITGTDYPARQETLITCLPLFETGKLPQSENTTMARFHRGAAISNGSSSILTADISGGLMIGLLLFRVGKHVGGWMKQARS